ncbi:uncharacterized protein LOC122498300 [Leptopilina heterotoma]|uniref:uncharacterized protein LOC122498300 n=1 Tax=Leptopilina heterotoma TaxID=63436 RepID=UPI001CA9EDE1|nr:uncharacterized protein LOC122498300 [Leptopilina heterotoma]
MDVSCLLVLVRVEYLISSIPPISRKLTYPPPGTRPIEDQQPRAKEQKILLQNLTVKPASPFNQGSVPFEFVLKNYTKITDLGHFNISNNDREITKINFEKSEVLKTTGCVEIEGFLRDEFIIPNRNKNTEYFGSITNGTFKLIVSVSNVVDSINFSQGEKLKLVGILVENDDSTISLKVNTINEIQQINEEPLPLYKLILGGETISRKPKSSSN